ncbi:MAG TPA: J domain-containing protein [Pyrinomonadaceae bacterium]|nr:J domain-containing protein [Pyrinomonadaceae bacterium]
MSQFDSTKDYYSVLGAEENSSHRDIERLYKRLAARLHPDRGGSEEDMKSLNEAYGVLKDNTLRREYDAQRQKKVGFAPVPRAAPAARDVGLMGHFLTTFLLLASGFFLLVLVRFQWIWFLWPLAILAVGVLFFGILMARSALAAVNASLPRSNLLRRHVILQEAAFWALVVFAGYGVYLFLSGVK